MRVVRAEDLGPEFEPAAPDEVARLVLEHLIVVGDEDELVVAEALGVGDVGEVRVALLAVLADDERVVDVVLLQELLRVVVRVDVNLGHRVVDGGLLLAGGNLGLEPREDELEPVALLDLVDELIDGDRARHGREERLDRRLVAVDVEEAADDLRRAGRVDALDVDLDEVGEAVLVQVQHEVVHVVEPVADDDERQLVRELGLLEEVLDLLRVVEVALAHDTLHLADLAGPGGGLDVLEVHLGVLAQVHDRAEVVVETCERSSGQQAGAWH